jgi:hypothetical protein
MDELDNLARSGTQEKVERFRPVLALAESIRIIAAETGDAESSQVPGGRGAIDRPGDDFDVSVSGGADQLTVDEGPFLP